MRAATGSFPTTTTGRQSIRGLPFEPKAVIAWWSRQAGVGIEAGNHGGLGFWTASGQVAVAWSSPDGVSRIRARTVADSVALIGVEDPSHPPTLMAELERIDPDGFTLRFRTSPSQPWFIRYLALGGDEVVARVGWLDVPDTPGFSHLDPPERRDRLLVFAPTVIPPGANTADGLAVAIGVAGPGGQAAAAYRSTDGASPGSVIAAQTPSAGVLLPHSGNSLAAHGTIRTRGSSGIEWSIACPEAGRVCYLSVEGLRCLVGWDTSTRHPGVRATRVGFAPEAVLFFSWGLAPSAELKRIGRMCIGGATSHDRGCIGWGERSIEGPTTLTHVAATSSVLLVVDTKTREVHAEAVLRSIDRRGFTLEWILSDGHPRQFAYVAFASDPTPRRRGLLPRW